MGSWTKFKQFMQSTLFFKASSDETQAKPSQDRIKYTHISDNEDATDLKDDLSNCRSIDDILNDIGLRLFHLKVILILALLCITQSYEVSTVAIILPVIKSAWQISSFLAGVLTLSISTGIIVGSWFWGWVCDKYGRKRGCIGGAIVTVIFAFAVFVANSYYWLWISLFLIGFATAIAFATYVMAMEFFPPKYRTMFSVLNALSFTIGFLLSAIVSTELSRIGFRWTISIVSVPAAIFLICSVFLPETPQYHLACGDEQKALDILQDIAPEMDLSNTKLIRDHESKRADITQLFRDGYWKITICLFIVSIVSFMAFYAMVYTASNIAAASHENCTSTVNGKEIYKQSCSSGNMYSTLAWMNVPELLIKILIAVGCCIFTVKRIVLTLFFLSTILQIFAFFVLSDHIALLVVTMLSRGILSGSITMVFIYASLLYSTENRSIGVGASISVGHIGTAIGPLVFVAIFEQAYFYGIVFMIGISLLGLIATALLPSRSNAIV